MNGLLVLDKPSGLTSHDVVAIVRRATGEKSIGHLGTLDPMATGVLPLLLGKYTRLAQFFGQSEKHYTGHIRFGFATDTFDAEGAPTTETRPLTQSLEDLRILRPAVSRRNRPAPTHLLCQKDCRHARAQTCPRRSRRPRQACPHHHPRLPSHLSRGRHRSLRNLRLRRRLRTFCRARTRPACNLRSSPLLPSPHPRWSLHPRPLHHHRSAQSRHSRPARGPPSPPANPAPRDALRHRRRPVSRTPP